MADLLAESSNALDTPVISFSTISGRHSVEDRGLGLINSLKIGNSFLDDPTVTKYSQLCKYKGGNTAKVEERIWKETD
jgi:hypothetical protein